MLTWSTGGREGASDAVAGSGAPSSEPAGSTISSARTSPRSVCTTFPVRPSTLAVSNARSGVDVSDIDAVIFGQVLQAGAGQNPARQTSRAAGIGWEVPAVTVNKVCLSGIHAVVDAARLIRAGEASVEQVAS